MILPFSLGVVIWEMLSGDVPHKGLDQRTIMFKSQNGQLDNLPIEHSVPDEFKVILNGEFKLCIHSLLGLFVYRIENVCYTS